MSIKKFMVPQAASNGQVDLTNCDREPIHIPGSIQPHGVLLALTEPDLTIVQVSDNTEAMLNVAPHDLLQQPLETVLAQDSVKTLKRQLAGNDLRFVNPLKIEAAGRIFDGIVHRVDGVLLLEMEPALEREPLPFPSFYHAVRASVALLQEAATIQQLLQATANEVRTLTGFDRVMIYRFHEDWHGEVVAEAKREDMNSYQGLHYPASDIPVQARELYQRNWLRLIADVNYSPALIVPNDNPVTSNPLDLSGSVLRSVSPMHIEYLKNMGVGASMSVSILKEGRLWGLISCHHDTVKYVPYEIRTACEFLGQMLSSQLAVKADNEDYAQRARIKDIQVQIQEQLLQHDDVVTSLTNAAPLLLSLVQATGLLFSFEGQLHAFGNTPDNEASMQLIQWLQSTVPDDVYATHRLSQYYPHAQAYASIVSGVLALAISKERGDYIVWLRPEVLQTISWGGNPEEAAKRKADNLLHPRTSFATWSQTVRDTALPWQPFEVEAVRSLREAVVDRVLRSVLQRRAEELAYLNAELERSNNELDAFTYVVSHDLKEPLRGIHNFASILQEDYPTQLGDEGSAKLQTLMRLSDRMNDLIESLLHYSRVGQLELEYSDVDLNELLLRTLDVLNAQLRERNVQVRVPRPLPTISGDRVRIGEVFSNLISNAIKYSDSAKNEREIEIGYDDSKQPIVFYVRDNGIGIREKYFSVIFQIFKRLHGRDQYSGGTGAGLTIVKRIVERHGGDIWVQSTYGEGTIFYFTLQKGS